MFYFNVLFLILSALVCVYRFYDTDIQVRTKYDRFILMLDGYLFSFFLWETMNLLKSSQ